MAHMLMLDTSIWLDIAVDVYGDEILASLRTLLESGQFGLVLPAVVVAEFQRHKPDHARQLSKRIGDRIKETAQFAQKYAAEDKKKSIVECLRGFAQNIVNEETAANKRLSEIEWLITNMAKIVDPTPDITHKAMQRGMEKKAPFHLSKNSVADAVILETLFAAKTSLVAGGKADFTFVTSNKEDFSDPKDHRRPHPDFVQMFEGIQYSINIAATINEMSKTLPSKPQPLSEEVVRHVENYYGMGIYYDMCPSCNKGKMVNIAAHPSRYGGGWSMWQMCEKCGFKWDTGDPYDD